MHNVRLATLDDVDAIAQVHVAAWRAAYADILSSAYLDAIDVDERAERWSKVLRGEVVLEGVGRSIDYVIEVEGAVRGFASLGDDRDAPSETSGELWVLYIDPEHWDSGLGGALMEVVVAEFARAGRATAHLWVLADNHRARRFYEKWGWSLDDSEASNPTKAVDIGDVRVSELRYSLELA